MTLRRIGLCLAACLSTPKAIIGQNCSIADPLSSIYEIACTEPRFSSVCELIDVAGLAATLGSGGPITLFLPNNDGFSALGQNLIGYLSDPNNVGVLEEVLLSHAVDSETVVLSGDLVCSAPVPMLSGESSTTVCVERTGNIFQIGRGNFALNQDDELLPQILEVDVLACNGVIHEISNVILPQRVADLVTVPGEGGDDEEDGPDVSVPDCSPSLVDLVCGDEIFSILCKALEATGLNEVLSQYGPFTVFAPIDDAFIEFGEATVAALLEEDVGVASLNDILLYHVVPNEIIASDDLVCLGKLEMANTEFTRTLCHSRSGRIFQIGDGNSYRNYPEIIIPDIDDACNGIAHAINKVILPKPASYRDSRRPVAEDKENKIYIDNKRTKTKKIGKYHKRSRKSDKSGKKMKYFKRTRR